MGIPFNYQIERRVFSTNRRMKQGKKNIIIWLSPYMIVHDVTRCTRQNMATGFFSFFLSPMLFKINELNCK